jgi:hypothetical protein
MIIRLKTKFSEFITVITNTAFKSYKNKIIERNFVPSFIFSENQIIIVIGQDGFVKIRQNTQRIFQLSVNPDKNDLMVFIAFQTLLGVENVITNRYSSKLCDLQKQVNDGQRLFSI